MTERNGPEAAAIGGSWHGSQPPCQPAQPLYVDVIVLEPQAADVRQEPVCQRQREQPALERPDPLVAQIEDFAVGAVAP